MNHEKSKKHKEGVAFLKEEMKESGDGIDEPLTLNEDDNSDEEEIISSSKYVCSNFRPCKSNFQILNHVSFSANRNSEWKLFDFYIEKVPFHKWYL